MPDHRQVRVGDLVARGVLAISDGYRMRNEELGADGVPFVRGGDIGDGWVDHSTADHIRPEFISRLTTKLTKPWDVAFITKGNVGRVGMLRPHQPSVVFAPQVAYWRSLDHEQLWPRFVYYLLKGAEFQACLDADKTHGAMVADYVSISQQHDFRLTIPPLLEQRAIAHVLGTLDDKIDLNRGMNETLEAMARALFKSWFVDFDPVRAKAEGRAPNGMDADTTNQFPSEFVESELGPIPKGWAALPVYALATYVNGAAYRAFQPNGDRRGLPIIKIAELKSGVTSQTKFSDARMPEKYRLGTGDVLFSWSGNPDTSIDTFVWAHGPAWLNQHIFRVEPRSNDERAFVLATLRYLRPAFAEIARNKQTTGLGHVTVGDMQRLFVVRPDERVLAAWDRVAAPLFEAAFRTAQESIVLARLRDELLPRLLSGDLAAAQARHQVEATA